MIRLLAFCMLLCPLAAAGQTVPVRSGEHDGFTRLVLDLPADSSWQLEKADDGAAYLLSLGTAEWSIDVSRVFERIGRERVVSLAPEAGVLGISLGCDCEATAFRLGERMLVIDVAPIVRSPQEVDVPLDAAGLPVFTFDGFTDFGTSRKHPLLPRFDAADALARVDRLAAAAESIRADIGHAAQSGLLDPDTRSAQTIRPSDAPSAPFATSASAVEAALGRTSIDFADRDGRLSIGGRQCTPDSRLEIASWSGGETAPDAIGRSRSHLYGEFDRPDRTVLLAHARQLLHLGFGAEARTVLSLDRTSNDTVLLALSFLVDGEADPTGLFGGQSACPGAASFWALLAGRGSETGQSYDASAVMRTFEALPDHLKAHLGPRAAERFEEIGNRDAARSMIRRIERALVSLPPELAVLSARLEAEAGNVDIAAARLGSLIVEQDSVAPEALLAVVDIAEQEATDVPNDVVEMTAALAAERRHDESGPALWRAHAVALVANGDFDAAFAALDNAEGIAEEMRDAVAEKSVAALAESAEDLAFLKHAFSGITAEQSAKPEVAVSVAARLLDLGLADAALDILERTTPSARTRDINLLAARANLALRKPEQAEILLIGLQGAEADSLRGSARSMMGDHARAAQIFAAVNAPEAARRASWLSGDLPGLATDESDVFGRTASFAMRGDPEADSAIPSLAVAERLAREANDTRDMIASLLSQTKVDDDRNETGQP